MIDAAIICRTCNHNNALHKKQAWRRPEPRHNQSTQSRASGPMTELPTISPRKDNDVNLLHFPSALNKRTAHGQAQAARQTTAARLDMDESQSQSSQTGAYPPWRDELKERVRRIKEKRATSEIAAPNSSPAQPSRAQAGETKLGRNPIVEAALNRLRWASREKEGRRDRETEGRRDGGTEDGRSRMEDRDPRSSILDPRSSVLRLSVLPSRSSSKTSTVTSTGKGPAGAPDKQADKQSDKQVKARVSDIARAYEPSTPKTDPAPIYARLLAGVCDFEIVFLAFLLIFGAYATSNDATSFAYGSRVLMALLLSAVVFTYQIVMLAFAGRTFGMALLKLNLVNAGDEGRPVTFWQKLLRASAATIVFICFPLYLTAWFSASRRTMTDLVSGTTVA
jgi:uncharacterized RDD family membrane protein YckC